MANSRRTVIYIGSTNDLEYRVLEHRYLQGAKFTHKYKCFYLIYFERYPEIQAAIDREKQLKNWKREWKINLIRQQNPRMKDLSEGWYGKEEIINFKKVNGLI